MPAKDLRFHEAARESIARGVTLLADAVRGTLGPHARTVVLESPFGPPRIINSGVAVAREIELADAFENMGAQMVRQVASRTSEVAGDGTTTATLLAEALVREGMKHVAAGMNPMSLQRGLERATACMVEALSAMAKPCATRQEIMQVASISANNDAEIGTLVADAIERVGKEGAITVEDGSGLASELEVVEGLQFDRGYLSPYFINTPDGRQVLLEDALVLVSDRKLSLIGELVDLLDEVVQTGHPLLVIAEDVEGDALATLVVNSLSGVLKTCAVKAPGFGDRRKAMLEDIAILTGATLITEEAGLTLEHAGPDQLGRVKRVEIDRDHCTLAGGAGDPARIQARAAQIKAEMRPDTSDYDRDWLRSRVAKLTGGVALLKVGGATETEMKERKARVEDALHATHAAIAEGVLPGGGVALLRARASLAQLHGADDEEDCGMRILWRAVEEPLRQLARNSGLDESVVLDRVAGGAASFGFNAATGAYGDMLAMGVLDPCKVTRTALQNAVSVAGLFLTTDCLVARLREASAPPAAGEL